MVGAAIGGLVGIVSRYMVIGVGVFSLAMGGILLGRRKWNGRREYLLLWARRFEHKRTYRRLDPDVRYSPLGARAEASIGGTHEPR